MYLVVADPDHRYCCLAQLKDGVGGHLVHRQALLADRNIVIGQLYTSNLILANPLIAGWGQWQEILQATM